MNLCDSDWMIDFLNGREQAVRLLQPMIADELAISVIAVGEVYEGILQGRDTRIIEQTFLGVLDELTVVYLDVPTVRIYADWRGRLRRVGRPLSENDLYIAATALRHDLTLVTRNRKHFDRIDGLRIHDAS